MSEKSKVCAAEEKEDDSRKASFSSYPSEVEFEPRVFLVEFILMISFHLLGPLSYPLLYSLVGYDGMKMRLFLGKKMYGQALPAALIMVCTVYAPSSGMEARRQYALMIVALVVRSAMIASKYAYMSSKFYSITRTYSKENEYKIRLQEVGHGWMSPPSELLVDELEIAMKRNNVVAKDIRMDECHIISSDECSLDPSKVVEGYDTAVNWLHESCSRNPVSIKIPLLLAMLVTISAPITLTLTTGKSARQVRSEYPLADRIVFALTAIVVLMIEGAHFLFLLIAIVDAKRRLFLMQHVTILIAPPHSYLRQESILRKLGCLSVPTLEKNASTVHAWVRLRRVINDFGKDYLRRLGVYYSISMGLVVFSGASMFGELVFTGEVNMISPNNTPLLLLSAISLGCIIKVIMIGKRINMENIRQADVLLEYSREIEARIAEMRYNENDRFYRELQVTSLALQSAREQLSIDYELRPYRVMGIAASNMMVKVILSLIATYALALMRMAN